MSWRRRNDLLFSIMAFSFGMPPGPLLLDLLKSLSSGMVVADHGSTEGVILGTPEPYNDGTTTILLDTLNKRYELSDKSISDRRTHFVLHKSEQLSGFKLITNTAHYPKKDRTPEHINPETWKLFFPTLIYNNQPHTTRKYVQQKLKKHIPKQEGLKSYLTFHASILSTF